MSYGVGCRHGSDLMVLWLQCRLAAAAPIRPLAWEPPYSMNVAIKRPKKKKRVEILRKNFNFRSSELMGHGPFLGMVNWETKFGVSDKITPFFLPTSVLISQLQWGFTQTAESGLVGQRQGLVPNNN